MNKKVKVVMLPTNKGVVVNNRCEPAGRGHLYVVLRDEIQEDDWFYNQMNKIVIKATNRYSEMKNPLPHLKIIATTNPKLLVDGLPQIHESFIHKYCEQGGIDEVMVEHERYQEFNKGIDSLEYKYKLKISTDNFIILQPIKDSWCREELVTLLKMAWIGGGKDCMSKSFNGPNEWIKEIL